MDAESSSLELGAWGDELLFGVCDDETVSDWDNDVVEEDVDGTPSTVVVNPSGSFGSWLVSIELELKETVTKGAEDVNTVEGNSVPKVGREVELVPTNAVVVLSDDPGKVTTFSPT